MKGLLACLLVAFICLAALSGCGRPNGDVVNFSFALEAKEDKYLRGETAEITATVTNVSGRTHRYMGCSGNDFIPFISLYNVADGEKYYIECDPLIFPEDVVRKSVKNGESGSVVYTFPIPEDARIGYYSVVLSYGDETREFLNVLSISDVTSQNENEKYGYGTEVISSGGGSISPVDTLVYTNQYAKDGTPLLCGDGDGRYKFFGDPEAKPSDLPTIVADGEVVLTPTKDSTVSKSAMVYKTTPLDSGAYMYLPWEELHLLPAGEYVVVYDIDTDSRDTNPNAETYWLSSFERIFCLVVPVK